MRKSIIIGLLLIVTTSSFGQQLQPSPTLTKQDYLTKSRHQKTAAWILASGGTLTSLIGTVKSNPNSIVGGEDHNRPIFLIIGLTAIGSSIPLFIASSKNKRKAMSVSFKNETAPQLQKNSFVTHSVPSLTLKINL